MASIKFSSNRCRGPSFNILGLVSEKYAAIHENRIIYATQGGFFSRSVFQLRECSRNLLRIRLRAAQLQKKKTVAIENFFLKSRLLRISVLLGCLYMDFTTPYALPVSREVYCFYIKSTPIFVDVNTSATGQRFGSLEVIEAVVKTNSHQAAINLTKYAFPHALVHTQPLCATPISPLQQLRFLSGMF